MRTRTAALVVAAIAAIARDAGAQLPRDAPPPAPAPADPPITPLFAEGSAAPATPIGRTGITVKPGLEVIAEYDFHLTQGARGTEWFHSFELPLAQGSLEGAYGPARARLVVEAVRSAEEGALLGVADDSLLVRVREASAGYHRGNWLAIDAGLVSTITIAELDGSFALRAVSATPLQTTGLASPADLGATARILFPSGYGFAAIGAYDGEGYASPELNRGKNVEMALELHPVPHGVLLPVGLFGSYVLGSEGTGSAVADRLTLALLWQGMRVRAGAAVTYAWGVGERGEQRSMLGDAFVRAEPVDRLLFGVRGFAWERDLGVAGDTVFEATGAAGYRIADPLEAFVGVTRTLPESAAAAALPGTNGWTLRLVGHVVF